MNKVTIEHKTDIPSIPVEGLKQEEIKIYSEIIDYSLIMELSIFKRILFALFLKKYEYFLLDKKDIPIRTFKEIEPGFYEITLQDENN